MKKLVLACVKMRKKKEEGLGHVWKDVREEKEQDIDGRETREDFERV